jgi:hypothetical protein
MEAVSGVAPAPRSDYPPFVEEAVAGAALALEKGHPHALRIAHATKAEEWLDPKSMEGVHFHRAVARVLGGYEPGVIVDMSPRGMMEHIVADTVNTTLATRMQLALRDRNPIMLEGMNEEQVRRVEAGRTDERIAGEIALESRGSYEMVSRGRRHELIDVFHERPDVSPEARAEIDRASRDVEAIRAATTRRNGEITERIADFREAGEPLFRDRIPSAERMDVAHHAEDLAMGIGRGPMNEVEAGVAAHVAVRGPMTSASSDGIVHDARVAVMVDAMLTARAAPEADTPTPAVVAMRIEGLSRLMRKADDYAYSYERAMDDDPVRSRDMQLMANGDLSSMTPDAQVDAFRTIQRGDVVPALTALRLHGAVKGSVMTEQELERAQPKIAVQAAHAREAMSR